MRRTPGAEAKVEATVSTRDNVGSVVRQGVWRTRALVISAVAAAVAIVGLVIGIAVLANQVSSLNARQGETHASLIATNKKVDSTLSLAQSVINPQAQQAQKDSTQAIVNQIIASEVTVNRAACVATAHQLASTTGISPDTLDDPCDAIK